MKRIVIFWLILLSAWLVPGGVAAHANLVDSKPAVNAVIAEAPTTARLRFTEPLEASYSRVVLASAEGGPITTEPSRIDPDDSYAMLLDLPPLSEGTYVLQWRTLSSVDGHTLQGSVPFVIGDPAAANAPLVLPPPPPDPLATPPLGDVLVRWLTLISLALVVGTLVFRSLLWRRDYVDAALYESVAQQTARLALVGAVGAALAAALGLVFASIRAETPLLAFAIGSRVGQILSARLLLAIALGAVLALSKNKQERPALLLGIATLTTVSLVSHSAVPESSAASLSSSLSTLGAVLFDLLHLVATAAWIGTLPALLLALLAMRQAGPPSWRRNLSLLISRYSGVATAAIVTLAATGTFAALRHLDRVAELWTTTYGRALAIKLALFGVLLLLGAFNRWWVQPRLEQGSGSATAPEQTRLLRLSVAAEVGFSVLLLLAVGVLTASAPANTAASSNGDYSGTARVAGATIALQVARGDLAGDTYAVTLRGLPEGIEPEVLLHASMPAHGMGEQELKLKPVDPGRWGERAALLSMAGEWSVEAIVRAPGMNDLRHTFLVDTTPVTSVSEPATTTPMWVFLIVGACLIVALSQLPLRKAWQHRFQLGGLALVLGAFVAAIGPYYVARATEPTNPFEPTPDVLAAGKTIYAQNCVTCHGVGGRGDGPAARTLPGLPADFTVPHFATHTDDELYGWIRGGKPGTVMPAFGERLTEAETWQVLTYIRTIYVEANQ